MDANIHSVLCNPPPSHDIDEFRSIDLWINSESRKSTDIYLLFMKLYGDNNNSGREEHEAKKGRDLRTQARFENNWKMNRKLNNNN